MIADKEVLPFNYDGDLTMTLDEGDFRDAAALLWQRILRVDREAIFENSADDVIDRAHGFDRLPQPGFLGGEYRQGGVLLIGQNPGNDGIGKGMSAPDQLQYRLLANLRDTLGPDNVANAFGELMVTLRTDVMPHWKIIANVVQPLLDGLGISLNQIAYTNLVKFRTGDSRFGGLLYQRSWQLTSEQIDLLAPEVIVTLGVGTHRSFGKLYEGGARVYKIARGIGDSFLPAAGADDIVAICASERHRLAF